MPRVIDNPKSGERFVIQLSGADTGGEVFVFDLFLQPGGHVPAGHLHPSQEERFTIQAGRLRFKVRNQTLAAEPGETVVVPADTPHWFGNPGPEVAHVRVEVRPALRMEELFDASVRHATSKAPPWSRALDQLLMLLDFQPEVGVPKIPAAVVRAVLTPVAWLRARSRRACV